MMKRNLRMTLFIALLLLFLCIRSGAVDQEPPQAVEEEHTEVNAPGTAQIAGGQQALGNLPKLDVSDLSNADNLALLRNESLCLGAGACDDEMLVTWQGGGDSGHVEAAPIGDAQGDSFSDAMVYQAEIAYVNAWGANTYRAVLTDLEPGREYIYRVVDIEPSEAYKFTVSGEEEIYSFIVHGDPQISKRDDLESVAVYEKLVNWVIDGQKPGLILSLGDQSDKADDPGLFFRYLSAGPLKELPLAAIVGNHERGSDVFSRVFYMPNVDEATAGISGDMSGDFWFYRNHILFLCLNSNNDDYSAHQRFMEEAEEVCLACYGKPDWIIAAFHHSPFSAGSHAGDEDVAECREGLVPLLQTAGVDVVFSGHDHSYTRSNPMDGIVYFSLGSPTGTKYYGLYGEETEYAAKADGGRRPAITRVDVTETVLTVTTFIYQESGSLEVMDSYEIYR